MAGPDSSRMEKAPAPVSLRINESTKRRIAEKSLERKKSETANDRNDKDRKEDRKNTLAASMGKWTNPMLEAGNASNSSYKPTMKKKKSKRDVLSHSDHGLAARVRKKKEQDRVVGPEDTGKLGGLLGEMEINDTRPKKQGARSVVSEAPSRRRRDDDARVSNRHSSKGSPGTPQRSKSSVLAPLSAHALPKSSRRPRSQSPHALRKRTQSPGRLKDRSERKIKDRPERPQSPGRLKDRSERTQTQSPGRLKDKSERPQSPGRLKARSERMKSPGRLRDRTEQTRSTRRKEELNSGDKVSRPGDNNGKLGSMLERAEKPSRSSRGARSVASAPAQRGDRVSRPEDNDGKLGKMLETTEKPFRNSRESRSVVSAPAQRADSRPQRRSNSQGPLDNRSRRSRRPAVLDDSLVREPPKKHAPRRTKSADDDLILFNENDGAEIDWQGYRPSSRKGLATKRLSRKDKPFRKDDTREDDKSPLTKEPSGSEKPEDDDKTSTTHRGDSSSIEEKQNKTPKSKRSVRQALMASMKRSKSTEPRLASPQKSKPKEDGRAAMMKRAQSLVPAPTARENEEEEEDSTPHGLRHTQSMLSHRENQRRGGKTNSLMDLVHYNDDEIHSTSYFASNHVLVNRERMKRGLRPLTRNIAMDELARASAQRMSDTAGVSSLQTTYVGNVLRGESIRAIHRATMQNKDGRERANLMNPYYQDFGVGTAKGKDGMLYVCQLFSERIELVCTNTDE